MGDLYRSEPMQLIQLFIPQEVVQKVVESLGQKELIEFVDLNESVNAFQKHFVNEIKRLKALERQLKFFESQLKSHSKQIVGRPLFDFKPHPDNIHSKTKEASLDEIEQKFDGLELELRQLNKNQVELDAQWHSYIERKYVLTKAGDHLNDAITFNIRNNNNKNVSNDNDVEMGLLSQPSRSFDQSYLSLVTCVVARKTLPSLERQLWRSLHGNLYIKKIQIKELLKSHDSNDVEEKCVAMIYFRGKLSEKKIKTLCHAYHASIHDCPSTKQERIDALNETDEKLSDLNDVLSKSTTLRGRLLADMFGHMSAWRTRIYTELFTFNTLNRFRWDRGHQFLVAVAWCPVQDIEQTRAVIRAAARQAGSSSAPILKLLKLPDHAPPTLFRHDDTTRPLQILIDAYGVPAYREINPALFAVVTFPFLFGVMFGDVGHGAMLMIIAGVLIALEKRLKSTKLDEIMIMLFGARYLLLAMGAFSVYVGLLYSDFFGVAVPLFTSRWSKSGVAVGGIVEATHCGGGYPFGFDPVWKGAANELEFTNSLKKKMAVLLGVAHMAVGVLMGGFNAKFFNKPKDFWHQFVPQMLFFCSIFGYLFFLIVLKWIAPGPAPPLLNILIDMFLSPGTCCDESTRMFFGQDVIQVLLFIVVLITLPWMLFAKPCLVGRRRRRQRRTYRVLKKDDDQPDPLHPSINERVYRTGEAHDDNDALYGSDYEYEEEGEEDDAEHSLIEDHGYADAQMHQGVHTIEFVLGSVSNTASYLRLWALSLAHAELSLVFWERIILTGLYSGNPIVIFVLTSLWLSATLGIMVGMEALSAFLHALRLHWVEFQNKFYQGDGRAFKPFSLRASEFEELMNAGSEPDME